MRRTTITVCVCAYLGCTGVARAQQPSGPIDLASLPDAIKKLKWQDIDLAKLDPREHCRALMLLNVALDEIGAQSTTEADLMSQFIDEQNLGPEFASHPPPTDAPALTATDALRIAVALLRGPMAQSSFATELTDTPDSGLAAYMHMYESTVQRRWSTASEGRRQVRCMSLFLTKKGKMDDYQAWVPTETRKRDQQYEQEMAQRRSAQAAQARAQEHAAQQREADIAKQKQEQQYALKMQQAICAAQQSSSQQSNNPTVVQGDGDWYPGWYYGGMSYLGAGAWYRDAGYRGAAAGRTDARVAGWHGAGRGRP
jgi:hypothetical protein